MENKKLIKTILKFTKLNFRLQLAGFVFMTIYSLTVLLSPAASGYLVDETLSYINVSEVMIGVCCFCAAIICQPVFGFFKDIIYMNIIWNMNSYYSSQLFKKIMYAPMCFFDKTKKGEIISKLLNDTKEISNFVSGFFTVLIKNLVLITFIMVCMFYISAKITIIILFLLIIFFLVNKKLNDRLENLSMEIAKKNDLICTRLSRNLDEIISIKCFCNEERVIENYNSTLVEVAKANKRREILAIIIRNFSTLVIMISLSFIYFCGCIDVLNGTNSIGNVISLGLYYQLIMTPLFEIVGCLINIKNIKPIFERFYEIVGIEEEKYHSDISNTYPINEVNDIHMEQVTFGYNNEVVIENLCLDTPSKGYIGITGQSGEGKSTLIKLLIGFYRPKQGKILIGDIDLEKLGSYTLRKKIAFVSQDVLLFSSSIMDNFLYANQDLTYYEIVELCKKVNVHDKIMATSEKYETIINEIPNLSGGEKQRIGIAMALAKKSSILLLDEPTSALDLVNEGLIVNLLKEISKEKLVIVISHKQATLEYADKIYSLKNGNLKEINL